MAVKLRGTQRKPSKFVAQALNDQMGVAILLSVYSFSFFLPVLDQGLNKLNKPAQTAC